MGFHISEATNGQEALDAVQRDEFDCILMDQEMPVMGGTSATIAIHNLGHKYTADISILGVTTNIRATQQTEILDAGRSLLAFLLPQSVSKIDGRLLDFL